jgi:hypothetical protein
MLLNKQLFNKKSLLIKKNKSIRMSKPILQIERIVLLDFIHCLVSQKIEELKIYIPNITIHTSTKFTQGSITNHRATYLGAYTHKPLKQVRHQWQ